MDKSKYTLMPKHAQADGLDYWLSTVDSEVRAGSFQSISQQIQVLAEWHIINQLDFSHDQLLFQYLASLSQTTTASMLRL